MRRWDGMRRLRLNVLAISIAALLLLLAVPSAALAGWGGPTSISPRGEPDLFPDVAMSRSGRAVAVWYRARSDHDVVLRAAVRPTGGRSFKPARTIGRADYTPPAQPPSVPQVAMDTHGNAIAVWLQKQHGDLRVAAAVRPHHRAFRKTRFLSPPGEPAANPQITFDRKGNALAVWTRLDSGATRVQSSFRPRGKSFGAAKTVSQAGHRADDPQVAFDERGDAVAVWVQINNLYSVTMAARRPSGGNFGTPQQISVGGGINAQKPHVAMGPKGSAIAVWDQGDTGLEVATAFAPAGHGFGASKVISATGRDSFSSRVGIDARGRATALWVDRPPNGAPGVQRIRAAHSGIAGKFKLSNVVGSSSKKDLMQPEISVTHRGAAVAAWIAGRKAGDSGPFKLRAAARPGGATGFRKARTVTQRGRSGGFPSVANNGGRHALTVWLGGANATARTVFGALFRFA